MTGPELAAIRKRLGLTAEALAAALGYNGNPASIAMIIYRFEAPKGRHVPPAVSRLATMFDRFGVPADFLAGRL